MGKSNLNKKSAQSEMKANTVDTAMLDPALPWWMPADLDIRAERVAEAMIAGLPDKAYLELKHLQGDSISLPRKKKLVENVLFSIMASPDYRQELARWALLKPLEVAKLHASMMPKNVQVDADVRHQHVIVVPTTTDASTWNEAHLARKEFAEGDWGTNLSDTPFAHLGMLEGEVRDV